MRTILLTLFFVISLSQTSAQVMRDVWLSMPDSLLPYLDGQIRSDMLESFEKRNGEGAVGKLQESSSIEMMTPQYISVSLNDASTLQMRLLPTATDTLICVVRTYSAPQAESEILFYNTQWEKQDRSLVRTITPVHFFVRPETMSESRFAELVSIYKECLLVSATLDVEEPILILRCSSPVATKDEQKEMEAALVQISLKWDGKFFN